MKTIASLSSIAAIALSAQAFAADPPPAEPKPKAEIVSYDKDGKPDVVRVDGYEYKLCKGGQKDSCINPQDAGFDWGGREIKYWPGRPASEIAPEGGKLPEYAPGQPKDHKTPG